MFHPTDLSRKRTLNRSDPNRLRVAAVTSCRSDFGRMLPLYRRIQEVGWCELLLVAGGSHFGPGSTLDEVIASGLPLAARLEPAAGASPHAIAAHLLEHLAAWLEAARPDCLLLLGDRYETLACAMAAHAQRIPILHLGGGYQTRGAMDDAMRHAISMLADWHLVANAGCAERLHRLGRAEERIRIVGAPDLDMIRQATRLSRRQLLESLDLDPALPFLLVTLHPETRTPPSSAALAAVMAALAADPRQLLITAPAPDPGANAIQQHIDDLVRRRADVAFCHSLGESRYISALYETVAVVGNSSSAIIEASILTVPVIDVGERQGGRPKSRRVVHCGWSGTALAEALLALPALPPGGHRLSDVPSPYGDGTTSEACLRLLAELADERYPYTHGSPQPR